jgi:hypothetical protein
MKRLQKEHMKQPEKKELPKKEMEWTEQKLKRI